MPLGDDFDGTIGDLDGGLIVNRVRQDRQLAAQLSAFAMELSGSIS
jgi:hypothetical protein